MKRYFINKENFEIFKMKESDMKEDLGSKGESTSKNFKLFILYRKF